jgi:RNA polymerase sigma-70 factor (ECF subfamily)
MTRSNRTSIGGAKSKFLTTHWSEIRNVKTHNEVQRRTIINALIEKYWKPVYCYLKQKGYDNETAKDLTQGFFHEIVLVRCLVQRADETKGRFRTFLLTALDHYVTSIHRANIAAKRYPKDGIMSLGDFDEASVSWAAKDQKPEELFTYVWASVLMDDVLAEVKDGCFRDGKGIYWQIFRARVLDPIMTGTEPCPVSELCKRLKVANKAQVSNMIVTVKRRFQVAMSYRIRHYVDSDEEVEQEIRDLMKILSRTCAS